MRAGGLAWVVALVAVAACDDVSQHIFTGQLYEPSGACLDPSTAIDVVSGPAVGDSCTPVCLVSPSTTMPSVYVSTLCGPYPVTYSTETIDQVDASLDASEVNSTDPCVPAFMAFQQGASCAGGGDGGGDGPGDDSSGEAGDDGGGMGDGGDGGGDGGDATLDGEGGSDAGGG